MRLHIQWQFFYGVIKKDISNVFLLFNFRGIGSVVGVGTMLQVRKVAGSIAYEFTGFLFNLRNPSSRTMPLGSTEPPKEISTKNLPGGGG
jgi:hypothetical protein